MLDEAAKEIEHSNTLWNENQPLRDQQETDIGYWGSYEFKMPKEEGKWDNVTTNSPKILANKIMGLLSSSTMQLFIDVDEEKKKERQRISNAEMLANGSIWLADRRLTRLPSGKKIQPSLSSFAVLEGGTVKLVYWYEKDGEPICDIKVYDPMFTQWEEGEEDIVWFCHRAYVTERFIKRTYAKEIKDGFNFGESKDKKILTYTFWDDDEWKVAINKQYIDGDKHGLGYVPVNIRSCGSVPYIQSEKYKDDAMRFSWQSYALNTREIYDLESKLISIESTNAVESGKRTAIGEYSSLLSNNQPPDLTPTGS